MILYLITFVALWALKFVPRKPLPRETQLALALLYPLITLGFAFLWNIWARHLIGWPAVDSLQEFVLAILVF